jgi:hypothetical protein
VLLLYTEKQLHTAYKVFIREFCPAEYMIPTIDIFREMFEEDESIQALAEKEYYEH